MSSLVLLKLMIMLALYEWTLVARGHVTNCKFMTDACGLHQACQRQLAVGGALSRFPTKKAFNCLGKSLLNPHAMSVT